MSERDALYQLLPTVHRERDADEGYPLRALMRIIGAQAQVVEDDIQQFWDDLFIETCRPWVVPYLGDLVGNRLLFDAGRTPPLDPGGRRLGDLVGPDLRPPIAVRTRADVAKTIYYRRRKGTLAMLEELARDVTGWAMHAVEMFERLGWHQHREHQRPGSQWADLRNPERTDRVERAFDEFSHTADVRAIAQDEGWHNIANLGFFAYRLGSFLLRRVPARVASAPWRYHFSPLGNPAPLFSRWRREADETGLAHELDVPAPIRAPFFFADLQRYRERPPARPDFTELYGLPDELPGVTIGLGRQASFFILRNGAPVTPAFDPTAPLATYAPQIVCRRLDPWPATQPAGQVILVDVTTGRMAIGDGWPDATLAVDVYFHAGFPAELGGGPYERGRWLVQPRPDLLELFVQEGTPPGTPNTFASMDDALVEWVAQARRPTAITIRDSRSYALTGPIVLPNDGLLVIQAANGERPVLATPAAGLEVQTLPPLVPGDPDRAAALTLNGVVVEGHLEVTGDLGRLRLLHATLVPGRRLTEDGLPATTLPSLAVAAGSAADPLNAQLRLELAFSITGPLVVPAHADAVWISDSIVDGVGDLPLSAAAGASGPPLETERSTFLGGLRVRSLEMSEGIATALVQTQRTQAGCVRFSFVPAGSRTPRRYRCQPDLAAEEAIAAALAVTPGLTAAQRAQIRAAVVARVVPAFTTVRYGQPAYAQLRTRSPLELRTGAEDGSEMGAYCHLKQPQREANLRLRLDEYLPFGLEAGLIFAT
jgi:hypothetical protein